MAGSFEKRPEQHICAALLAHVDAGKTTLSEALLYRTGDNKKARQSRSQGCVFRYGLTGKESAA